MFDELLGPSLHGPNLDLLTVHGRTVKEMYRRGRTLQFHLTNGRRGWIARSWETAMFTRRQKGESVLQRPGGRGLKIGRGSFATRGCSPIRPHLRGEAFSGLGAQVLDYITDLFEMTAPPNFIEKSQVQKKEEIHELPRGWAWMPMAYFFHNIPPRPNQGKTSSPSAPNTSTMTYQCHLSPSLPS
ncbi:MAG: hypothetical protein CM1200mP29_03060 [Verrucomicrobiota bacterium]|nr:MAG: hypothetical protein CM1200mP29_03060 [Verrucomicrobiota bacterium]